VLEEEKSTEGGSTADGPLRLIQLIFLFITVGVAVTLVLFVSSVSQKDVNILLEEYDAETVIVILRVSPLAPHTPPCLRHPRLSQVVPLGRRPRFPHQRHAS
jgi:hypothetical protein